MRMHTMIFAGLIGVIGPLVPAAEALACTLRIVLKNGGTQTVSIAQGSLTGQFTGVRPKGKRKSWLALEFPPPSGSGPLVLGRGAAVTTTYKAPFGCDEPRRFRVSYGCTATGQSRTDHFPSQDGWTRKDPYAITLAGC